MSASATAGWRRSGPSPPAARASDPEGTRAERVAPRPRPNGQRAAPEDRDGSRSSRRRMPACRRGAPAPNLPRQQRRSPMPEPREVTIALIDQIQKGFNDHDVDAILSHFADDCDWLMAGGPDLPEGRRCVGKAEIA